MRFTISKVGVKLTVVVALFLSILTARNAGAKTNGPLVSFRFERDVVSIGQPVLVDLVIENRNPETLEVDLGGNGNQGIRMTVIAPDGRALSRAPYDPRNRLTFSGRYQIEAGKTFTETIVLNDFFAFDSIGEYSVKFSLDPYSGSAADLQLKVKESDPAETETLCDQLSARALGDKSAQDSIAVLDALAFIKDPVVVGAWGKLLERPGYRDTAISELVEIGDVRAARSLVEKLSSADDESAAQIRLGLKAILAKTADGAVKLEIQDALRGK